MGGYFRLREPPQHAAPMLKDLRFVGKEGGEHGENNSHFRHSSVVAMWPGRNQDVYLCESLAYKSVLAALAALSAQHRFLSR